MAVIKDREIFSVGTWRGSATVEATKDYIAAMVQSYIELNSKVPGFAIPIKLGHNKRVGEPAFGYAENVRMSADGGTVLADFMDMPPEIVDAITKKQYNAVSVEIYPKVEYAGKTYPNVLSGVALLGAEWPAVKGLKPLSMSSAEEVSITLSKEDDMPNFTQEQHDTLVAAEVAKATLAADAKTTTEKERADRAEAALASFSDEAEKKEIAALIEAAEKAGKIVPANKPSVVAMAEAIRVSVEPSKRKEALAHFKEFVEKMPTKVSFAESGKDTQHREGDGERASTKADLAAKALIKDGKAKDYRSALDLAFANDPELKTAYAEENR